MNNTKSIKEFARLWNLSERRISVLCNEGRIPGAVKKGKSWEIPADATKPSDGRIKGNKEIRNRQAVRLPLPVGISDYRLASTEYYYIDKTLLIKDFLDERPMVSLFTRPRRFGKTLTMDMLRTFFEKTNEDTSIYFKDKAIWQCGEWYQSFQGKYPVIFLSFKDVKFTTWQETLNNIAKVLQSEFGRHKQLLESSSCSAFEKEYFKSILDGTADEGDLVRSLLMLSKMLDNHFGIAPIIIIDEYDTPIQQGHMSGFYEKVVLFMRNFFSGGFKDNKHLSYGFMTGILRVAKESIFSGLNNIKINSILDNRYSCYFGFTSEEVAEMVKYYGVPEKYEEICEWYDGYRFGKNDIFNPWSVINYFSNECEPRAFWQSTGNNDIISEVLENATEEIYMQLQDLMQGKSVLTFIDTGVIYPQIRSNPSSVYSFLLVAGYLKAVKATASLGEDFLCEVSLPNKEITFVYNKEILSRFNGLIPQTSALHVQQAIYTGNVDEFKLHLERLLLQTASCFDTVGENFYHGLVLGLCAVLDNRYFITSNRESGEGRYDIQLMPKGNSFPGIILELKAEKGCDETYLKTLSEKALHQIQDKKYDTEMIAAGIKHIWKYGIAFSGKHVSISKE